MSKSKGIVLGAEHLTPGNKTTVGSGFGLSTRSIESVIARDEARLHTRPDHPPVRTAHVPHSQTRAEHFHAGSGDTHGGLNAVDSRDGSVMGLDKRPGTATADSPVPVRGREMPHVSDTGKAQEVAREDPSTGLGVRPTGTLDR